MTLGFNHLPRQFSPQPLSARLSPCRSLSLSVCVCVCFMAALRLPHSDVDCDGDSDADFCLSSPARAFNLAIISNFNRLKYLQFYRSAVVVLRIRLMAPPYLSSSSGSGSGDCICHADTTLGPRPTKKNTHQLRRQSNQMSMEAGGYRRLANTLRVETEESKINACKIANTSCKAA